MRIPGGSGKAAPSLPVSACAASPPPRPTFILKPGPGRADHGTVRATILGMIGVLWGGAIVASGILDRSETPDAAHVIGDLMAIAFGALLLAAGARALVRRFL
jgi:hypothetical protein